MRCQTNNQLIQCVEIHNSTDKCQFYLKTESCQPSGILDYMYFIYCVFPPQSSWIGITLCILFLLLLFIGLGVTADDFLCPSLVVITKTLRLSQNIAGVTFLAFGNGAPDIFSSLAGTEQARLELVIGTLFGAGIFVTSVVAGSIMVSIPFKTMQRPFLRDIIFYICAAFLAFLRFYYGEVTVWHSVGFIVLYIVYILVVIISRVIFSKFRDKKPPQVPEIEISTGDETNPKINFQPSGDDDNPEAVGVVLRRFSFRGSIFVNVSRKRHSHHEHVIKAITQSFNQRHSIDRRLTSDPSADRRPSGLRSQSVDNHSNPAFGLETQISQVNLLSSNGKYETLREFFLQVCPIDVEAFPEKTWPFRIFDVIKAPICGFLILTVPVVDYENEKNNWCRPLCVIQCISAPVFVIFAVRKYNIYLWNVVPLWSIILSIGVVVAVIVYFTSKNDSQPVYHAAFGYIGFITSVIWVYLLASEIVSLLKTIGTIFKLSDAILGLTVLAWGNSIGDFISNLSVARQGYPRMGISACYGGPLLNMLLGTGIPYTLVIVKTGHPLKLRYERMMTLLYSTLTVVLLSTIVTMTALRFQAKRSFGIVLITIYVVFLTFAIILETGIL